jgi:hypothetical protein
MNVDHAPQQGGKARGGKPGKGFVHDLYGTDLFLGKFVGPLKIVDLDLPGIRGGGKISGLRISGVDGGEKLVYFILGQYFGHVIKKLPLPGSK